MPEWAWATLTEDDYRARRLGELDEESVAAALVACELGGGDGVNGWEGGGGNDHREWRRTARQPRLRFARGGRRRFRRPGRRARLEAVVLVAGLVTVARWLAMPKGADIGERLALADAGGARWQVSVYCGYLDVAVAHLGIDATYDAFVAEVREAGLVNL